MPANMLTSFTTELTNDETFDDSLWLHRGVAIGAFLESRRTHRTAIEYATSWINAISEDLYEKKKLFSWGQPDWITEAELNAEVQKKHPGLLTALGTAKSIFLKAEISKLDKALSKEYQIGEEATEDQYCVVDEFVTKVPMEYFNPEFWTSKSETQRQDAASKFDPGRKKYTWQERLDAAKRYKAAGEGKSTG